jgi:hypothetical protein
MLYDISPQDFAHHVRHATCWHDLGVRCGLKADKFYTFSPGNRLMMKQKVHNMRLNIDHFLRKKKRKTQHAKIKISSDKVFVVDSQYSNGGEIKKRLLRDFDRVYECDACKNVNFTKNDGVLMWNNQEIVLQLEHINGVHTDNRIENLIFLCPNCHSQTSTFGCKNSKKRKAHQAWLEDGKTEHAPGSIASLLN